MGKITGYASLLARNFMAEKLHQYSGEAITVTWSKSRCIHVAECLRRLGVVFDTGRGPWVLPDAAPANEIAETITHCPSGALHFQRHDGGTSEAPAGVNTVTPRASGPLYVRGEVVVVTDDGEEIVRDTRLTLCRCGASKNKPFCDNSHVTIEFRPGATLGENRLTTDPAQASTHQLTITAVADGPLQLRGPVEIRSKDGQTVYRGNKAKLCRCGQSGNKPFCDGTHNSIGFRTE
jgi:CDGSH-type Zn-finger protein/uncharacterized Fe-S cluster protein YjdI